MNTNTKYWSVTWETNKGQRKLPATDKLQKFFSLYSDESIFQYEVGKNKKKIHIQGVFTLVGRRRSKKLTLRLFEQNFKNITGLTILPVYDRLALEAYVTKDETRIEGPYYGGKNQVYDNELAAVPLRNWQKELFSLITGPEQEKLRDRTVIWVEDDLGRSGKSWFQKWLRCGQRKINARNLPVDRSDRLASAINLISKSAKIDVYCFDLTRTKAFDQHFEDLFNMVEQIKNGMVISCFRGNFNEAIFHPPIVLIFSNQTVESFLKYLSRDRWKVSRIDQNHNLIERKLDRSSTNTYHFDNMLQ